MLGRSLYYYGRIELFKHITVLFQQQAEELSGVMRHEIDFEALSNL